MGNVLVCKGKILHHNPHSSMSLGSDWIRAVICKVQRCIQHALVSPLLRCSEKVFPDRFCRERCSIEHQPDPTSQRTG